MSRHWTTTTTTNQSPLEALEDERGEPTLERCGALKTRRPPEASAGARRRAGRGGLSRRTRGGAPGPQTSAGHRHMRKSALPGRAGRRRRRLQATRARSRARLSGSPTGRRQVTPSTPHPPSCTPNRLSIDPSIRLSKHRHVYLSIHTSIYQSIQPSIHLSPSIFTTVHLHP